MPINKNEITKEMLEKAIQCETVEELMAYAKSEGVDIIREEAEAYIAELSEFELKDGEIKRVAGDFCGNDSDPGCREYLCYHWDNTNAYREAV